MLGVGINLPLSADVSLLIDSNAFIGAEEYPPERPVVVDAVDHVASKSHSWQAPVWDVQGAVVLPA